MIDYNKIKVPQIPGRVYTPQNKAGVFEYEWKTLSNHVKWKERPKRLCIDIGAHIGIYALKYAQIFQEVHSFEAVTKIYKMLDHNTKDNDKITTYNLAAHNMHEDIVFIGNSVNTERGFVNDNSWEDFIKQKDSNRPGLLTREKVLAAPIDSFEFKDVDFIKVDTEGVIMNVLEGMQETLRNNNPIVQLETSPCSRLLEEQKNWALDYMRDLGYVHFYTLKEDYYFRKGDE